MSYRPPRHAMNTTLPPRFNMNFVPATNDRFSCNESFRPSITENFMNSNNRNPPNSNPNLSLTSNEFVPPEYDVNRPIPGLLPPNQFYNNAFDSLPPAMNGVPFPYQNSTNNFPSSAQNSISVLPNFAAPYNQNYPNPLQQDPNQQSIIPANQDFSYSQQNVASGNPSSVVDFKGYQKNIWQNVPGNNASSFNVYPQNSFNEYVNTSNAATFSVNTSVPPPINMNNQLPPFPIKNSNSFVDTSGLTNLSQHPSPQWTNSFSLKVPPPTLVTGSTSAPYLGSVLNELVSEKEQKLSKFLQKYSVTEKKKGHKLAIPEFRSTLRAAFSIMKLLIEKKFKLSKLLGASENEWNTEMHCIINLKEKLSEICSSISSNDYLNRVSKKLNCIKKKRERKKKTKLNKLSEKIKAEQNRKELNQEIDKWLDDIKEKNLKLKREVEMKKEADFILLEVRKKIQEANRTIEKIKVFEKLRNARQTNSVQKGLHIQPEHNEKFQKKISILKETMLRQLADYEAEEKALKVMLETEQEGQMEEKAQWELKKLKTVQEKKRNHIIECLFGNSEDPLPTDPLYLFHKFHTSGNNSIESFLQIRHHWDVHTEEDGEAVPQQWVVPVAPSSSLWEKCLIT